MNTCCTAKDGLRAHEKIVDAMLSASSVDYYQGDAEGVKPIQVATDGIVRDMLYEKIGEVDPNAAGPRAALSITAALFTLLFAAFNWL